MSTNTNTRHAAKHDVEQTRTADVEAALTLHAEDPALLEALRSHVVASTHDDDVVSLAMLTGARLLVGDPDRVTRRAAAAAVKQARAVVAAHRSREYVDDETVQAFHEAPSSDTGAALRGAGLSPITAPGADARWNVTRGDLARALRHVFCTGHRVDVEGGKRVRVCTVEGPHAAIWQDTLRAYAGHRCERCAVTKRPALAGVLAHTRGLDRTDSEAWRLRRLWGAAADAAAPRVQALAEAYAAHRSHRDPEAAPRAPWGAEDVERLLARLAYVEALPAPVEHVAVIAPLAYDVERVERVRTVDVPARVWRVDVEALRVDSPGLRLRVEGGTYDVPPRTVWNGARGTWQASLWDARTLADVERAFTPIAPLTGTLREAHTRTLRDTVARVTARRVGAPLTDAPDVEAVTVRTRTGDVYTRPLTDAERGASKRVRDREARFDGEAYGDSAHRANTPDTRTGAVPSGKRPESRKRGARGASGPNVPAGRHASK